MKKPSVRSEASDPAIGSTWDVVLVPFPYSDRLSEKRRPALVVSSPWLHDEFNLVWVAMITSSANRRWNCDVEIRDLRGAGLPAPSVVRPAKIATVEPERIVRQIGTVEAAVRDKVAAHLRRMMAR